MYNNYLCINNVFIFSRGVSHSALSDMKTIEQESPLKNSAGSKSMFDRDNEGGFDDFFDSFSTGSSSGFSM